MNYIDPVKKYNMEFIQKKLDVHTISTIKAGKYFILAEQTTNRFMRFVWASLIVLITSIACFLLVKGSIDWATSSKTELNKLKANQLEEVTKEINTKYSYVMNTDT